MSKTHSRWILLAVAWLALSGPAAADWLVLQTGEEVETRGEWKVDGRRILYTSTRGTLSSVRLSAVDVDRSRALTQKKVEEAAAPPEVVKEPERGPAILAWTDADFPAQNASPPPPAEGGEEAEAAGAGAVPAGNRREVPPSDGLENRPAYQVDGSTAVEIVTWSVRPTGDGQVSVLGYLRNSVSQAATAIAVTVTLLDSEDLEIESVDAQLSATSIMPGVQAFYEAKFSDIVNFASVEFSVSAVLLDLSTDADPDDEPEA